MSILSTTTLPNKMAQLLIDSHYLPSLEYIICLLQHEKILMEVNQNFQKQTYMNRCYIATSQGVDKLIIPILHPTKQPFKDIKMDLHTPWSTLHWRALQSAYGKAPFFELLMDEFHPLYLKPPTFLLDFNLSLLQIVLKLLGLKKDIQLTERFITHSEDKIIDLRSTLLPKITYTSRKFYQPIRYKQVFTKEFIANLSIVDLLFCKGNQALDFLYPSKQNDKDLIISHL